MKEDETVLEKRTRSEFNSNVKFCEPIIKFLIAFEDMGEVLTDKGGKQRNLKEIDFAT